MARIGHRGRYHARAVGAALVAAVVSVAFGTATATANAASGAPVRVAFEGSGTFTIDQTYVGPGGECTTHDVVSLAWVANFDTTIDNGVLKAATGELAAGVGPGNVEFTIAGTCTYKDIVPSCSSALGSTGGGQASMTVAGTDPQRVEAQSLQPDLTMSYCSDTDTAFMGSDLSVLQESLPDSVAAVVDIPRSRVAAGYSRQVSSADSPGQVESACLSTGRHGSGNVACSASLTWSGTLSIACGPACKKVKRDAAEAAKKYLKLRKDDVLSYKYGLGCRSASFSPAGYRTGALGACTAQASIIDSEETKYEHYKQIAHDPPDPRYGSIARPRAGGAKNLKVLRQLSPLTYRLVRRDLQIAGLVSAVATALNRKSGARLALSRGDPAAAADLAKQAQAARTYAKRAARLLGGQRRLGMRAAAQLRQVASRVGARAPLVAVKLRLLAARLSSKPAAQADRLAAAALQGIGRGALG